MGYISGEPSHPDSDIRGGRSQKKLFQPFGPQFGLKIKGALDPPLYKGPGVMV